MERKTFILLLYTSSAIGVFVILFVMITMLNYHKSLYENFDDPFLSCLGESMCPCLETHFDLEILEKSLVNELGCYLGENAPQFLSEFKNSGQFWSISLIDFLIKKGINRKNMSFRKASEVDNKKSLYFDAVYKNHEASLIFVFQETEGSNNKLENIEGICNYLNLIAFTELRTYMNTHVPCDSIAESELFLQYAPR